MTQLKSFFDIVNELSMKSDKKLPNLKVPVKGKRGVSKFMRKKVITKAKDDLNAGFKTDANRKAAFAKMNDAVHSADRKPEKYIKPDGKVGIRMVKTDKEIIKKEEVNEAIKHTHAVVDPAGKVAGMTSNERDAKDIARRHKGKVIKLKRPMSPNKGDMMINRPFKEAINHSDAHRDAQTHSDGSMSVKKIPSMIKKPGDKHLHLHMKSYHKEKDLSLIHI